MRTTRSAGLCGLLVLAVASTAGAQQFTGGLRGAVRDANGVVPGVTVTLTNEGTAISRETTTNEQGQYTFSAVTPGTYSVKAEVPGFKTYQNQGIRIGTQTFITLDILLRMSSGLRWAEDYDDSHRSDVIAMLYGDGQDDMAAYVASRPPEHDPDTVWNYSSGDSLLVSRVVGDAIVAIGGRRVAKVAELRAALREHPADQTLLLTIQRAGRELELQLEP